MTPEEIKEQIEQNAAILAHLIGPEKAAEWLESLAVDVADLPSASG